jgi:aspartate kinase
MIIQSSRRKEINDIAFTVAMNDFDKANKITKKFVKEVKAQGVIFDSEVAKVSIVGAGITSDPLVAARMFGALSKEEVNIDMISTSGIRISCLIKSEHLEKAVKAIHKEFNFKKAGGKK